MVERSSRYLHHIVEEIEKRGMPMELALLPMVESAYNPTAYSRSHASGLWQFVPATGKQYKLEQNWWVDERRDIVASTAAALEYLQYIYDLHGDWHLALASYNWGEGAVGKAINKNKANGLPTDYLSLNDARGNAALRPQAAGPEKHLQQPQHPGQPQHPRRPQPPYFATVTKTANIDVKLAAKLAEMPVQEFVALNPAHNRPVIKSETPMVIPADKLDTFISNLEAHEESDKPLSSWQAYTLRAGREARRGRAAFRHDGGQPQGGQWHQRQDQGGSRTDPAGRRTGGERHRPGRSARQQAALQPPLEQRAAATAGSRTDCGDAYDCRRTATDRRRRTAPTAGSGSSARRRARKVSKGETLLRIAQRYGMSLAELKADQQAARQSGERRHQAVGRRTRGDQQAATPSRGRNDNKQDGAGQQTARPSQERSPSVSTSTRSHTVRKGETLSQVASRYDMSGGRTEAAQQAARQPGERRHQAGGGGLRTGQQAGCRPGRNEVTEEAGEKAAKGRPSLAKADARAVDEGRQQGGRQRAKNPRSGRKQMKVAQYTIRRGDTLVSIAKQFRVEKDDLLRWNRIESKDSSPAQTLTIQLVQNTY
jgi:membrane-bound lytic murein transglycosylase D